MFVADNMLGGTFALNGGRFGSAWCLTGDRDALYDRFARLPAFREPAPAISLAWSFYPFLWTKEAGTAPPAARVVPADQVMRLRIEFSGFEIESDGP